MKNNKPLFITFEGSDGSGKTTMLKHASETLRSLGYKVSTTREPGGTPIGEQIRSIIMSESNTNPINEYTQLLLFFSARLQHLHTHIVPLLREGYIVLCDRYMDSSTVYQGIVGKLENTMQAIYNVPGLEILNTRPDYTFLFEVNNEISQKRIALRSENNGLDIKYSDGSRKLYNAFKFHFDKLLSNDITNSIQTVNSNNEIEIVQEEMMAKLLNILKDNQREKYFVDNF